MRFCLNIIRKIIIRVTSSKRYQNVRSDLTILGPFANVILTLCVSWVSVKRYFTTYRSLYRHVVCNVLVSGNANGDRTHLGAQHYSDQNAA